MHIFLNKPESIEKPCPDHNCCDICCQTCVCTDCLSKTFSPSTTHLPISDANESCLPYSKELEHKLVEYRNTIFNVQHPTASYFLGFQLSVGVTDEVIKYIYIC